MKKIIRVFSVLIVLASLFSCDGKKIYVDQSKSTAPVLENGTGGATGLSADFTPGELNVNNAFATHTLAIVDLNGKAVSKVINSKLSGNKLTATAKEVSRSLYGLGIAVDSTVSFKAAVRITLNAALDYGGVDSEKTIDVEDFKTVSFRDKSVIKYYDYSYEFTEASDWSVIGSIASTGNGWDKDEPMITNGTLHVYHGLALTASDEFKFRQGGSWDVNLGGTFDALDAEFAVEANGANIKVAEDGVYDLILNPEAKTVMIMKTVDPYKDFTTVSDWSVIGSIASTGNGWNQDEQMLTDGNGWSVAKAIQLTSTDEFKFRQGGSWDVNLGGDFGGVNEPFSVEANGANIKVADDGLYDLLCNFDEGLAIVCKAGVAPSVLLK